MATPTNSVPPPTSTAWESCFKDARALLELWDTRVRANGKIPGALIGELAESVTTFTKNNPTSETTPRLLKMLPRLDATRDWQRRDAVALLDELAAVQVMPIEMLLSDESVRTIRTGTPLPEELANAPWGETQSNGLRLAWLLEPRALKYRLCTPLNSNILIHNAGKNAVVFRTEDWHQFSDHKARDANGEEITVSSTYWTRLPQLVQFRLAPGEFVEIEAAGIGVGEKINEDDRQGLRVGSWIDAKERDVVTFAPAAVPLGDGNAARLGPGEPRWWLDFITARLSRERPLPADAEERTRLLDHALRDLFGAGPTPEEMATFVADRETTALDSLAKRLANRAGLNAFSGSLTSGTKKFLVLPADPDAAKKPRLASHPGWYTLGDHTHLSVTRRLDGKRIVNEASIVHYSYSPDRKADPTVKTHAVKLPDGYNTWAAAWERGTTVLWVQQTGSLRRYDFTNPAEVKETQLAESDFEKLPQPILEALRAALDIPGGRVEKDRGSGVRFFGIGGNGA